jgi:hypothetical protein
MASEKTENKNISALNDVDNLTLKPDFLLIGAARSGTTWLYQRLVAHRGVFVTPVKELHYFDIQRVYPLWHWIRVRRYFLHVRRFSQYFFKKNRLESTPWLLCWATRYFLMPKTHTWYSSLFNDQFGRIAGELTPAYSLLSEKEVREVYKVNPKLKVIYQMRDPIDRAWSQIVMHLGLHLRTGDFTDYMEEIREVMLHDEIIERSMYTTTIQNWEKVFGRDQICYLFFDEILEQPVEMLKRAFTFLEVDEDEQVFDEKLREKVAARDTKGKAMPSEVEYVLAKQFIPMLENLDQTLSNAYTRKWMQRAQNVINSLEKY